MRADGSGTGMKIPLQRVLKQCQKVIGRFRRSGGLVDQVRHFVVILGNLFVKFLEVLLELKNGFLAYVDEMGRLIGQLMIKGGQLRQGIRHLEQGITLLEDVMVFLKSAEVFRFSKGENQIKEPAAKGGLATKQLNVLRGKDHGGKLAYEFRKFLHRSFINKSFPEVSG